MASADDWHGQHVPSGSLHCDVYPLKIVSVEQARSDTMTEGLVRTYQGDVRQHAAVLSI